MFISKIMIMNLKIIVKLNNLDMEVFEILEYVEVFKLEIEKEFQINFFEVRLQCKI